MATPDTSAILDPTPQLEPLDPGDIDLVLCFGQGRWPGLDTELLFATPIVIVAAPQLVGAKKRITPAELAD